MDYEFQIETTKIYATAKAKKPMKAEYKIYIKGKNLYNYGIQNICSYTYVWITDKNTSIKLKVPHQSVCVYAK